MAKKSLIGGLAIALAGAIALPSIAFAAPPAPMIDNSTVAKVDGMTIEPAATYWKKKKPGYGYNKRWHGDRYRYRHGNYRHYHNGYYYASPWWLLTAPLVGGALSGAYGAPRYDNGNSHVEWCLDRYRSYNPRTDRFLGYDGEYHRCNSPY